MSTYFEDRKRDNGDTFTTVKEDAPAWVKEAVHAAHGGDLPCDWIYETCRNAFAAIGAGDISDDDSIHEWADSYVDVYTKNLARWYADHCLSDMYACAEEEEARDRGTPDGNLDINKELMSIQYFAIRQIVSVCWEASEKNKT